MTSSCGALPWHCDDVCTQRFRHRSGAGAYCSSASGAVFIGMWDTARTGQGNLTAMPRCNMVCGTRIRLTAYNVGLVPFGDLQINNGLHALG
jgi:hypothetical protein